MEGLLGIDVRGMIWIVGRFDKGVVRMKFGMIRGTGHYITWSV